MLRPTVPADDAALLILARDTGVFRPIEITALEEVLRDYHAHNRALGHQCVTCLDDGRIVGFAYFAPAAMTDRTWYLYWIAVSKQLQARGIGAQMLRHCETAIREAGGRLLLIETSSLPHYDLTRKFYLKHGYQTAALLPDYYADGDDMVVFGKRMR
ncbi:MAG: GNAT family N-acetyltransferase [Pirellulales bacterium]|nr:GNAT family N-acetyltransferase [Pirellulales bacterium]